ncbi:50S ribosomal protein L25/general stress protein Ctc [Atopomonas sediminilitoris]|uniref:50S ribosomal protein L25/general stress protein Ctc n=1 Tax=Atopomonas sediminilitoris TaxID=2919919 RepID=UPI001F4DA5E9|nr:50S ribosomal protein L25/general stress protein Ctc [Atopomonas sediminilitoris]MCJ8169644.1 50S ribosomal protein L25/general stress protein Ctc [Atopomonas sediminilitoris]
MTSFTLNAQARSDMGKGASRRLRRNANLVPAIVYGGDKAPQSISLVFKDLTKLLENDAAFSHVLELSVDGTTENVLIKDLQRHPAKNSVTHVDFIRVVKGQKLTVTVPLHFINEEECVGVKQQGGAISHTANDLEIEVLPRNLPEFIEVDMAKVELGQVIHLSDLKLPEGVEALALTHGNDLAIANVHQPRVVEEEAATEEAPTEAEAEAEEDKKDEE